MFRGRHELLLDDKGRVAFPADLRGELERQTGGATFVLTQSMFEPCLVAMTEEAFQAAADKIRALPASNPAVRAFKRVVIASSFVLTPDKAGRVTIPKELRGYAGLEREVMWAGVLDNIEIWSKTRWDAREAARLADTESLEAMRETLEGLGL